MPLYQRPQFREANGSLDWRQVADMFIPGNVWNSRTNEYRPLGIAQGLTGIPVDTFAQLYRAGAPTIASGASWLRGLLPYGSSANLGPVALGGRPAPAALDAFGNPIDTIGQRQQQRNPWQMPGTFGGERNSASRNLGMGVLGSAGDAALQYYSDAINRRGGALMER